MITGAGGPTSTSQLVSPGNAKNGWLLHRLTEALAGLLRSRCLDGTGPAVIRGCPLHGASVDLIHKPLTSSTDALVSQLSRTLLDLARVDVSSQLAL